MTNDIVIIEQNEWYQCLVTDCKAIVTERLYRSRQEVIEGWHEVGQRIATDKNYQRELHKWGNKELRQKLANDIKISIETLYRAIQFYNKYPELSHACNNFEEGKNISWHKIVKKYLPAPKEKSKKETTDGEAEKAQLEWRVENGQIWLLGKHRLMCGDAYNPKNVAKLLDNKTVNGLIADPPYGIGYKPDWNKWDGSPSDFSPIIGDNEEFDPTPFLSYPTVALFGANYFSNRLPVGGWICWDKRLDEDKDLLMFGSPFELAWFRSINTTRKAIMIRVLHGGVVNADSAEGNNEKRLHTTQKPVAVMQKIIDDLTMPDDVIYDPFSGSGSTLIAAEKCERTCFAMEIDPKYVAVTLQRWFEKTKEAPCLE